jgi:hypothetical protein
VVEPPQLIEARSGQHIGGGLVAKVERRVAHLRRMDDFVAGGDLHERRLLVAIGELCQLAGWVTGDAGNYPIAAHYHSVGIQAAHAAGDAPLAANIISTLAYQVSNVGNPHEAILLAQTADTGAKHHATPITRALFKERVAVPAVADFEAHVHEAQVHELATKGR